jgi:hypothetical protein
MKAHNDNEPFSFITLAAATANVTRYLVPDRKEDDQRRDKYTRAEQGKKQTPDEECEYVEHRLREIAAWERKISGKR